MIGTLQVCFSLPIDISNAVQVQQVNILDVIVCAVVVVVVVVVEVCT